MAGAEPQTGSRSAGFQTPSDRRGVSLLNTLKGRRRPNAMKTASGMWIGVGANHHLICTGRAPKTHERIGASDGSRGLASCNGPATAVRLHAQRMPATLQEEKVRGRIATQLGCKADRRRELKPRSRTCDILDRPTLANTNLRRPITRQKSTGQDVLANGMWARLRRKRPSHPLREQTCVGLLIEPYERRRTERRLKCPARPARPRWPKSADKRNAAR